MRTTLLKFCALTALVLTTASAPLVARGAAPAGPAFSSIGPLAFAADGTLFAADKTNATIFALDLSAEKTAATGTASVTGLDAKIAALVGTDAASISITDVRVHPKTHNSYVSVMRGTGAAAQPALVRVDGAGKIELVALEGVKFTSVTLPNPPAVNAPARTGRAYSVTDMALQDGRLYVTGLSNEEFSSKFWAVPYPFKAADNGTSVEIWHGSHNRFETSAPVLTFVPTKVNGQATLIAGYTCTPLVRFPVSDLKPGSKVMGTTIAELGAGNQPIDMFLYSKDGQEYLLMANTKHGVLKIATAGFGSAAGITQKVETTAGIPGEKVASMTGVLQLDRLDATHSIALARVGTSLDLQAVILP